MEHGPVDISSALDATDDVIDDQLVHQSLACQVRKWQDGSRLLLAQVREAYIGTEHHVHSPVAKPYS